MFRHPSNFAVRSPIHRGRRAFTLVEVLIVVVIIGILAAYAMPQFSNASQTARQNTLKDELRWLRTQVTVFKAQHRDSAPGYPAGGGAATEATVVAQMSQYTDLDGHVSAAASEDYRFGPYISEMPKNPVSGLASILIVADDNAMPSPDGTTGWIYKPQTQEIMANLAGNDVDGTPFSTY